MRRFSRILSCAFLLGIAGACGGSDGGAGPSGGAILDVTVTGLPAGTAARITVTGPRGFLADVPATSRLTGLAPGDYTVRARYVLAQGQTWTPATPSTIATLATRDSGAVQVLYSGGPAPTTNILVAGYSIIQSTQRGDNSIPMVGGRTALLRIYAVATGPGVLPPAVRVRLYNGATQVDSFEVVAADPAVPTAVDTASLARSWNVLIPAAHVVPGLSFAAAVDPDDNIPETNKTDNRFPPTGTVPIVVQRVPAWILRFVPIMQAVNGLTGNVSTANADALLDFTRRLHPLGADTVSVRAPYTTGAPVYDANDANGAWSQTLGEINALRRAEGATQHYVGVLKVTYGGGIAGLGYIGVPAAIAWDKTSSAPEIIAHELGHNFGRFHAPCGNPSGVDPGYPSAYAGASVGTWGLDLPAMQLRAPSVYKDVMSYCNPDWISDYNYSAIMAFRGSAPGVVTPQAAGSGLMVWGRIRQGSVVLEPAFVVDAPPVLPEAAGPHRVEGLDAAGNRVFALSFAGDPVPDLPQGEERHFAFVVPLSSGEIARLAELRLVGRGLTTLRRSMLRSGGAIPPPLDLTVRRIAAGTEVRWNPAYPLAVIRDQATGEILSFARNGVGRVTYAGRTLRVDISHGVTSLPGATLVAP